MTTKTTFFGLATDGWTPQTAVCRRRQNVVLVV